MMDQLVYLFFNDVSITIATLPEIETGNKTKSLAPMVLIELEFHFFNRIAI